jgi:hypothetical protein
MDWIAASVETGDNGQCSVGFHNEHQSVGKPEEQGAAVLS